MKITVKTWDIVHKPLVEVWDAVTNQNKIIKYFTSSVSSSIIEGKSIHWEFADYNVSVEIYVLSVKVNQFISFEWGASGEKAIVEIKLSSTKENFTKVEISEKEFESNNEGIQKVIQQTQGWTHFICSLKTWLYTGVNLRTGKIHAP